MTSLLIKSLQGRHCIYELVAEESAVNYWEVCHYQRCVVQRVSFLQKYIHIVFGLTQKVVLTRVLRYKPLIDTSSDLKIEDEDTPSEGGFVISYFLFTIRREVGCSEHDNW